MLNINSSYENIKAIERAYKEVVKETQTSIESSTSLFDSFEKENDVTEKKPVSGFFSTFFDAISLEKEHIKKMYNVLKNNATNLPSWLQTLIGQPHSTMHLSNHLNPQLFNQST